jgi:Peptidase family M28
VAWVNSSDKSITWKTAHLLHEDAVTAILLAVFLALVATFSIREHDPPPAAGAAVAPDTFSAGRAVRHLSVIAEKPHPMGSAAHQTVRDYLVKQLSEAGVEPQVQTASISTGNGPPLQMANVENVVARLKGTSSGKAVLLVAHYDSALNSFGASDDGMAVASLLETLRALKTAAPLKNDVIILFTDGEENGLLGARAFVAEHPWAKDAGVVLNFDARGNSGPVMMFETTNNNGWLIEQLAEASPYPTAHSLSYEIYRLLPNDTDMTVFKRAGLSGLNFANIDGLAHYHTPTDNLASIDQDSMQHQGSYALALTRRLGDLDLTQTKERNAVYFDLFGRFLVHYSSAWVIPLTIVVSALFLALLVIGLRKQKLTIRGVAVGFGSLFVSLLVASLFGWLLWKAVWLMRPSLEATQSRLLLFGFVALAIATTLAIYAVIRNRVSLQDLATGALLWWFLLMIVTTFALPGATFIFHWPLLFSLIGLGWILLAPAEKTRGLLNLVVLSLCAVPAIVLMAPVIYQIFVGLTLNWSIVVIALLVLLFGLLLPHLRLIAAPFRWLAPGLSAAAAVILLVVGVLTTATATEKPGNRIYYALNADSGKAIWASDLTQRDGRTAQFFTGNEEKGTLADFTYAGKSRQYTVNPAPVAQLPAPELSVLEKKEIDGVQTLRLRVTSARQAGSLSIYVDSNAQVLSASINNKQINDELKDPWGVFIEGFPKEGIELLLQLRTAEPLKIRLVDQSFGLPPVNAASNQQPPATSGKPDMTFVRKTFSL